MHASHTTVLLGTVAACSMFLAGSFDAGAADYTGPIASLWASTAPAHTRSFRADATPWITPASAPSRWIAMSKAFSAVGAAMKAADFGTGAYDRVFLRTSVDAQSVENMDSINLQDTSFFVPPNQVKSLTIFTTGDADVVTAILGQQPGGNSPLRLLDLTMTGMAAGSIIARKPVDVVVGTSLVFNAGTNTFIPIADTILEMTVN